jgi:C1A family cysteine protease
MKKSRLLFASIVASFLFTTACQKDITPTEDDGTGMLDNTKTELEKVAEADFDEAALTPPATFSLDGPQIADQASTSKCVAFSGAYYIIGLYNGVTSAAANLDKSGSPEFAYATYKKTNADADCNQGCYLFNQGNTTGLAEILKTVGTCSWNQMPFVNGKTCSVITTAQTDAAASNRIAGYARLDKNEITNVNELKSWIYAGYPLWFAVKIDKTSFNKSGTTVWKESLGASNGSHAMVLMGWDDTRKAFKIANSWGNDWGDNGFGYVDYEYFKTLINDNGTIGILYPNAAQKVNFDKLTPGSCSRAGWGEVVIDNKRNEEIAVEFAGVGTTYANNKAKNTDAVEIQTYEGIAKGSIKVKVYNATKTTVINEYPITVTQCGKTTVTVN